MTNEEIKPAGVWTDAKTEDGFVINVNQRADTLEIAMQEVKDFIKAHKLVPYERYASKSFGGGNKLTKPAREENQGCAECGEPVNEEKKILWKDKNYWTRDCSSGERHKTGFFRPAE